MKIQIGHTKLFAIDKYGVYIFPVRISNDEALEGRILPDYYHYYKFLGLTLVIRK